MNIDTLVKLRNALSQLDSTRPIVVQYNSTVGLIFRQIGIVVSMPYIRHLYIPKPKMKHGFLSVGGFHAIMQGLETLITEPAVINDQVSTRIRVNGVDFYKLVKGAEDLGPQMFVSLDFVEISNNFLSKIAIRWSGDLNAITILKLIKNAENKRKGDKHVTEFGTT